MLRMVLLLVSLCLVLPACSGEGDSQDAGEDGNGQDAGVVECTPADSKCTVGLECLCYGSIGPAPICLCTTEGDADTECDQPGHGTCNKPDPGSSGICTPEDYNCCWFCQ